MDYSTLAYVKDTLQISETTKDALISRKVTEASRAIDRLVTGRVDCADYYKSETVTDEILTGERNPLVDSAGHLLVYPHKPIVTAVTALSVRYSPLEAWQSVDINSVQINSAQELEVWQTYVRGRVMVKISYTGGLASATANLPADLIELATVLAARFYKEGQTGLSDVVGVTELGIISYVKALPARVSDTLGRLARVVPW